MDIVDVRRYPVVHCYPPSQTRVLLVEELVRLATLVLAAVLLDDNERRAVAALAVDGHVGRFTERALSAAEERDEVGVREVAWGSARIALAVFQLTKTPLAPDTR